MSELKHQLMLNKERSWVPCYLKSEADKVIAEKDDEITALKIKLKVQTSDVEALRKLNTSYLTDYAEAIKRESHSNHKRCLAMARYCEAMRGHYLSYEEPKWFWYRKWSERWLELAKEPTWAKFLQLIHKEAK